LKSPGRKSERAGFPKVLELFLTSATKYTYHNHNIITMKRKLNDQDVPEVADAVTEVETEVEAEVEKKVEKKTPTAKTFAELGLDARLLQAINKEKFASPTPVQARAIPLALSGKDVLGNSFVPLSLKMQD
jgi:rubrerythrin